MTSQWPPHVDRTPTLRGTDVTPAPLQDASGGREGRLQRQNAALVRLAKQRLADVDVADDALRASLAEVTETAATILEVARVSVWQFATDRGSIDCVDLFERMSGRHSAGFELTAVRYPAYFAALHAERQLAADDAHNDARTREFSAAYLAPLGITSMLDVPVRVGGEMRGIVCHEHIGPRRTWTDDELSFASAIADLLALRMEEVTRRRAEEELRERAHRFRAVFECAPLGGLLLDGAARITVGNRALVRMLDTTPAALRGQSIYALLHPDDVAAARADFEAVLSQAVDCAGSDLRLRFVPEAGADTATSDDLPWVCGHTTMSLAIDADHDAPLVVVMIENVTEHRAAEEALRRSEEHLRQLAEHIDEVFWMSTPDKRELLYLSPVFESVWGTSLRSMYERPLSFLDGVHPDDRARVEAAIPRQVEGTYDETYRVVRPDGQIRWVRDRAFPIRDDGGEIYRLAGLAEDVTARREAQESLCLGEEQLRHAQKMDALGRLAGGIAHDFNNLLTVIRAAAQFALNALPPGGSARGDVEEIERTAETAAALTQQLMLVSRRQAVAPRLVDLNALVVRMTTMLRRVTDAGIAIESQLDRTVGRVLADPGQLEQVVMNLIINARDAMPASHGRIEVSTRVALLDARAASEQGAAGPGRYVVLSVSDTGTGMDADTRERLFEPFFTTKPEGQGTGLGLSTVYAIVSRSAGHVRVRSAPGTGSTFEIYLPHAGDAAESGAAPASEAPAGGTETVLLVEADEDVRRLARRALLDGGYTVLAAATGEHALDILHAHAGEADLLVTDISPPGLRGPALVARVNAARTTPCAVLFVSAASGPDAPVRSLAGTPLRKPFTSVDLLRAVRGALDGAPVEGA